jgi:alanyl-tRNA synthetase
MPKNRISYLSKKDNWWAAGDTGPCGPDTEIFYWVGKEEFPPE